MKVVSLYEIKARSAGPFYVCDHPEAFYFEGKQYFGLGGHILLETNDENCVEICLSEFSHFDKIFKESYILASVTFIIPALGKVFKVMDYQKFFYKGFCLKRERLIFKSRPIKKQTMKHLLEKFTLQEN